MAKSRVETRLLRITKSKDTVAAQCTSPPVWLQWHKCTCAGWYRAMLLKVPQPAIAVSHVRTLEPQYNSSLYHCCRPIYLAAGSLLMRQSLSEVIISLAAWHPVLSGKALIESDARQPLYFMQGMLSLECTMLFLILRA
jgi:hypothetical protein